MTGLPRTKIDERMRHGCVLAWLCVASLRAAPLQSSQHLPRRSLYGVAYERHSSGLLYADGGATLTAVPGGAGASVSIDERCTTVARGALWTAEGLKTIACAGTVTSVDAYAASQQVREAAAVALGAGAGGAAWEAAGFRVQSAPEPGSEALPEAGGSGLAYRVLPAGGALEAFWAGDPAEAPEALSVPASASVQGVEMSVEALAEGAFEGCSGIQRAELPATLRSIGSRAFAGCSQLSRVSLPAGLVTIGDSAFEGCSQLAQLQLPDGLASIGDRAFAGTALPALSLPASVSYVGARAFDGCSQLKEIAVLGASCEPASAVLAGASGTVVYLPEGAPAWVPGLAASGNSVERYALSLPPDTLQVAADGSSTDLGVEAALPEGCRLEASYPASQLSVAVDGTDVLAKAYSAGSAEVAVSIVTEGGLDLASASRQVMAEPAAGAGAPEELPAFAGAAAGAASEAAEEHHDGANEASQMELPQATVDSDGAVTAADGAALGILGDTLSVDADGVLSDAEGNQVARLADGWAVTGAGAVLDAEGDQVWAPATAPSEEHHEGAGTPEQMEGVVDENDSETPVISGMRQMFSARAMQEPANDEEALDAAVMSLRAPAAALQIMEVNGVQLTGKYGFRATEISWAIYTNGLLELWPSYNNATVATMDDYGDNLSLLEWIQYKQYVKSFKVRDGKTINIGDSGMLKQFFKGFSRMVAADVTGLNTSKCANMSQMFMDCSSLQQIEFSNLWDVSYCENMSSMFENCTSLTMVDLTGCFTTNERSRGQDVDMSRMFFNCAKLQTMAFPDTYDCYYVANMSYMFYGCVALQSFNFPSSYTADSLQNISYMFYDCHNLAEVTMGGPTSQYNTVYLNNMTYMFANCYILAEANMRAFDVSAVTDMQYMFSNCYAISNIDLSSWTLDADTAVKAGYMFSNCNNLTTVIVGETWDCTSMNTSNNMFTGCTSIKGASGVTLGSTVNNSMAQYQTGYFSAKSRHGDVYWELNGAGDLVLSPVSGNTGTFSDFADSANTTPPWYSCASNVRTFSIAPNTTVVTTRNGTYANMFANCANLTSVDFTGIDTSLNISNTYRMFYNCGSIKTLDLSLINVSKSDSMEEMFAGCQALTELDLTTFNIDSVGTMKRMFFDCQGLTGVTFAENASARLLETTESMFEQCYNLRSMDLSVFGNMYYLTNTKHMFYKCNSITEVGLTGFNMSGVTDMEGMFYECSSMPSINLSDFDIPEAITMKQFFYKCTKLEEIILPDSMNSNKLTDMSEMFTLCYGIGDLDLRPFQVNKVTTMASMFKECVSMTSVDLSTWTWNMTGKVITEDMFYNCGALRSIYVGSGYNYYALKTQRTTTCSTAALL